MIQAIIKRIEERSILVGVIGLGYVGLPLAVEKAKAGFDFLQKFFFHLFHITFPVMRSPQ